jgi:hypothetical protein
MFIAPLFVGAGAAGVLNAAVWLFALTAFGFFLLRYPLMLALKSRAPVARADALRWSSVYGAITLVSGATLLIATRLWLLVPLSALGFLSLALYLWLASRREEMTALGEWIGIAGLALGAPGAYLAAAGALDATAIALYLWNVLYFGGTVFYIKFKVREQPRAVAPTANLAARLWAGRLTLAYHVAAVVLVALLARFGWAPALAPAAFVLPMCKVIGGVVTRPARLNLPRLGLIEIGFTVAFVCIVLLAYR